MFGENSWIWASWLLDISVQFDTSSQFHMANLSCMGMTILISNKNEMFQMVYHLLFKLRVYCLCYSLLLCLHAVDRFERWTRHEDSGWLQWIQWGSTHGEAQPRCRLSVGTLQWEVLSRILQPDVARPGCGRGSSEEAGSFTVCISVTW
jgi:hypothetical protein